VVVCRWCGRRWVALGLGDGWACLDGVRVRVDGGGWVVGGGGGGGGGGRGCVLLGVWGEAIGVRLRCFECGELD
jgi:hypothetical protein